MNVSIEYVSYKLNCLKVELNNEKMDTKRKI